MSRSAGASVTSEGGAQRTVDRHTPVVTVDGRRGGDVSGPPCVLEGVGTKSQSTPWRETWTKGCQVYDPTHFTTGRESSESVSSPRGKAVMGSPERDVRPSGTGRPRHSV